MRQVYRSHKSQYKMEQDKIRAPENLIENTYQLMKRYQLADSSLSSEIEPAGINPMVSPKMMILRILEIVIAVLVGTIAIIGLLYYLATTNNNEMQYPYKEGPQIAEMVEYLEGSQSEEGEGDTDSQEVLTTDDEMTADEEDLNNNADDSQDSQLAEYESSINTEQATPNENDQGFEMNITIRGGED